MSTFGKSGGGQNDATPRVMSTRVGLYFGLIQLFFALTWVMYVIYLPRLAVQAGIDRSSVPWILVLDQVIFAVCDCAAGVAADRLAMVVGRLGRFVVGVTALSALAFLLMPFATGVSAGVFLALIVIWSITSSALRAPPLKLLGRYTPPDKQPWVGSLFLLGTGVASAVAPFLAGRVTAYDPRIMFAISSVSVVVVTSSIVWAEKTLARSAPPEEHASSKVHSGIFVLLLAAILLLAVGFQVHVFINGQHLVANSARPNDVSDLLSLFWIAFSLVMLPASVMTKRFGGVAVMALGAFVGAGSAWATTHAADVVLRGIGQFVCGAAWGCVMMSGVAAALAIGRPGREGTAVGAMFSTMAVAAVARIAVGAGHFAQGSVITAALPWLPALSWLAAGLMLLPAMRWPARPVRAPVS
jgi:hypothetical protein